MGKLYVIESGSDASGKKTQSGLLYKYLLESKQDVKKVEFPNYTSASATFVKMYLNGEFGEKPEDVDPYVTSTFYALDRYATYKKELQQHYENGGIIIADRYTTSNIVYQAGKYQDVEQKTKFIDWLYDFEFNILHLPKPDLVIYLDVPFEISYELLKKRDEKDDLKAGTSKDIHEQDKAYLKKVYDNAKFVCEKFGWSKVDCTKDGKMLGIDEIHKKILNLMIVK